MSHRDEQSGLISALFSAASAGDAQGWRAFLERLATATRADAAALVAPAGGHWRSGDCPVIDPDTVRQMRVDRVYAQDNLPVPAADTFLRAVKIRVAREAEAVLQIRRAAHLRDFRSAESLFLDGLVPFLGQAIEMWQRQDLARRRAALTERVAAGLGAGWVLFDRSGTILDRSEGMVAWGHRKGLRLSGRWPDLRDPESAQRLRRGLLVCAAGEGPLSVTLQTAPLIEMRLIPERWQGGPAVLALFREAPVAAALPVDRMASHLGLSRSEARLVALLCDGENLRSAAAQLGWTEETARSTSKQIYARLGVSGQSGLLRRVLGCALWLG